MSLYKKLSESHPSIASGDVWCRTCGSHQKINPSNALQNGYPKCCGYTMTIDNPKTWSNGN